MQKEIAAAGLIVRDRSGMPAIPNTFRITIGTPEQNRKLSALIGGMVARKGGYDCVLFDMDGVLMDVRNSYRKAIEGSANRYFAKNNIAARISQQEVSRIKSIIGFNNDWDATYALVEAARGNLDIGKAKPLSLEEKNSALYAELKAGFQTEYLGGLMQSEKPLVSKKMLEAIAASGKKAGIVTGRPRAEAEFAVQNSGWETLFPKASIVALEDCGQEKPSPAPLLLAAQRLGAVRPIYVGDTASDVAACKAAKMPCIIVGNGTVGDWNVLKTDEIVAVIK